MKFKPLFDRVLISPECEENKNSIGLVLPQTSMERPQIGKIVAIGDGENFDNQASKMKVKIGDVVVFSKYAGSELKLDQKTYIVLRQIDIIGVFENE